MDPSSQLAPERNHLLAALPFEDLDRLRPRLRLVSLALGDALLLPLDENWSRKLADTPWPTHNLPEVIGHGATTVQALIREYLFISLFRACAESLASENASRLAAMERADRNIDQLLTSLQGRFHRLRQGDIDEELFDVIAGFEALTASP